MVVVGTATALTACGDGGPGDGDPPTDGSPSPTATSDPSPTATPDPTTPTDEPDPGTTDGGCSADGLDDEPVEQPDLPAPVAERRAEIRAAAVACDIDELARIAADGGPFTYSFGGGDDPAAHWREGDAQGREPMRVLVEVLDLPHAQVEVDGGDVQHVWPAAFAVEDWADVSDADRQALLAIHSQEELDSFAEVGAYAGYRVGITADGNWLFFVAGD